MLFCPLGGGGTDCNNTSCGEQGPLYTSSRHAATSPFICRSSATLYWSSTLGDLLIDPAWLLAVMRLDSYSMYACNELVWAQSAWGIQLGVQQCDATKHISSVARIQNKKLRPHALQNVQSVHWRQFFLENTSAKKRANQQKEREHCIEQFHRRCYPPGLLMAPCLLWVMGRNHRWLQTKSAKLYLYIYLSCHSIEFLIWFLQPAASPVHLLCLPCIF